VAASGEGKRARRRYELPPRDLPTRRRNAVIVSLLAYAGLRPGELKALRWQDVRKQTLLIQRAATPDGRPKGTKTGQARTVRLLEPLAAELREWRLAVGRPPERELVIPSSGGMLWTKSDWQNWRSQHWTPACSRAGLSPAPRPYDLRHSFASLLLAEGRQPLEVAAQLGHSPTVLLNIYGHLLDEFDGAERIKPELEIQRARDGGSMRSVRQEAM
jgi:integrase